MIFHSVTRMAGRRILLLCIGLALSAAVIGQQNGLRLPTGTITLAELFRQIERQTGRVVIFNEGSVEQNRTVNVAGGTGTVEENLDRILPALGYDWQVSDRYVVVRLREKQQPVQTAEQPARAEFERAVTDYNQQNGAAGGAVAFRTDTVRVEKPHDGTFRYATRQIVPEATGRAVQAPMRPADPKRAALKTNLVWLAAGMAPNIAGEIGLGPRTSLEVAAGINRWNLAGSNENNKKMAHWVIKPEFRYWLCERFNGHFGGVHAIYGSYNVGGHEIPLLFEKEFRYRGEAYGGGVSYGYHWAVSRQWGVEFTAGVGVLALDYERTDCDYCARGAEKKSKTYFGPTSLGVKVVFTIK